MRSNFTPACGHPLSEGRFRTDRPNVWSCYACMKQANGRLRDRGRAERTTALTYDGVEWRPVVRYEGTYEVSRNGRVRRVGGASGAIIGRELRPILARDGHYQVLLYQGGHHTRRRVYVHTLILEAFVGPRPTPKSMCNHIDGCKTNNAAENLEWVTASENIRHAYQTGLRKPRGHTIAPVPIG